MNLFFFVTDVSVKQNRKSDLDGLSSTEITDSDCSSIRNAVLKSVCCHRKHLR